MSRNSLGQEIGGGRENKEGRWKKGVGIGEEGREGCVWEGKEEGKEKGGRDGRRKEIKKGEKGGVESERCFCRQSDPSHF